MARDIEAKKLEGVSLKLEESRYFLVRMGEHEKLDDVLPFLFCMSAFLNAFRASIYRMLGVTRHKRGETAYASLKSVLTQNLNINFLRNARNLETHGDGVSVRQYRFIPSVETRNKSLRSAFEQRHSQRNNEPGLIYWQFDGRQENLIAFCAQTLLELQEIYGKEISYYIAGVKFPPAA